MQSSSSKSISTISTITTNNDCHKNDSGDPLSGAEHFLVGLSPSYWSYIPLTIAHINSMKIVAGVNCLVRWQQQDNNNNNNNGKNAVANDKERQPTLDDHSGRPYCFPVSKCTLVGMIVYAEAKANNSIFYVLDDGTGFIDCLAWGESSEGVYALPSLASLSSSSSSVSSSVSSSLLSSSSSRHQVGRQGDASIGIIQDPQPGVYRVGDLVRVHCRIECISLSETETSLYNHSTNPKRLRRDFDGHTKRLQVRDGIFEVHVTKMELLDNARNNYPNNGSGTNALDWEANHWAKTIHHVASTPPSSTTASTHYDSNNKQGFHQLPHATTVLEWLGPKIKEDVIHRRNFPSADDTLGAWRVFGASCTCNDLTYKDALLYCHCQAKTEPLDPNFVYRDALLTLLVDSEGKLHEQLLHQSQSSNSKDNNNDNDNNNNENAPTKSTSLDFRFQYRTIINSPQLCHVARQVVSKATTQQTKSNAEAIAVATFRALRQDGIIHLLDERTDTYLLISRPGVLEPYIRRSLARKKKQNRLPNYLCNVPKARLQYVQRLCTANTTTTSSSCG